MVDGNVQSAIIGGAFALIGVFAGAAMARQNARRQENHRLLAEYYAELFACFVQYTLSWNARDMVLLISAIEKARLLCSKNAEDILTELEFAITENPVSPTKCGEIMRHLRFESQKDLGNRQRD